MLRPSYLVSLVAVSIAFGSVQSAQSVHSAGQFGSTQLYEQHERSFVPIDLGDDTPASDLPSLQILGSGSSLAAGGLHVNPGPAVVAPFHPIPYGNDVVGELAGLSAGGSFPSRITQSPQLRISIAPFVPIPCGDDSVPSPLGALSNVSSAVISAELTGALQAKPIRMTIVPPQVGDGASLPIGVREVAILPNLLHEGRTYSLPPLLASRAVSYTHLTLPTKA